MGVSVSVWLHQGPAELRRRSTARALILWDSSFMPGRRWRLLMWLASRRCSCSRGSRTPPRSKPPWNDSPPISVLPDVIPPSDSAWSKRGTPCAVWGWHSEGHDRGVSVRGKHDGAGIRAGSPASAPAERGAEDLPASGLPRCRAAFLGAQDVRDGLRQIGPAVLGWRAQRRVQERLLRRRGRVA